MRDEGLDLSRHESQPLTEQLGAPRRCDLDDDARSQRQMVIDRWPEAAGTNVFADAAAAAISSIRSVRRSAPIAIVRRRSRRESNIMPGSSRRSFANLALPPGR